MAELYQLPDGWEWKKLGNLTTTTSGGTPKRNEKSYWGGNIGWLKSGELNDGYITNVEEYITKEGLAKSSAKLFPKGTLLIAMYGATVGKLGLLEIETTTNQAICGILNDKNKFETLFMFYYFKKIRAKMIEDSFGGAQPNLSQTYIKDLDVPLPPLEEQKRIVSKLDTLFEKIDKSISLHQKNIDEANVFMASVLNDVFVELEEKYGLHKIKEIILKTKNKNPLDESDRSFTYIDISSVNNKTFKIEEPKYLLGKEAPSRAKKEVQMGDIVFATTRPNLKNIALVINDYENPIASTGFCVLRVNEKNINNFVFYYLLTNKLYEQIEPNIRGAQYPAISDKDLIDCFLPNAPLSIQQKVVEYLDSISEKMEKVKSIQKEKMESLKVLKASILDKAFRGEL